MRVQRCFILLGVARSHRNPAKPETTQQIADRALSQMHAPFLLDLARQIDPPPTNDPVFGELRTGPYPPGHHHRLLLGELRCRTRRALVTETGKPQGIVAMHPIAQALPLHAAVRRRLLARAAVKNQRQSQHPPRCRGILAVSRCPSKPGRVQIATGDRNRFRHPIPHISAPRDRIEQHLVWQALRVGFLRRWYYINPGNTATRFVNPRTGQSVVVDDQTGEVLHVGAPDYKY